MGVLLISIFMLFCVSFAVLHKFHRNKKTWGHFFQLELMQGPLLSCITFMHIILCKIIITINVILVLIASEASFLVCSMAQIFSLYIYIRMF